MTPVAFAAIQHVMTTPKREEPELQTRCAESVDPLVRCIYHLQPRAYMHSPNSTGRYTKAQLHAMCPPPSPSTSWRTLHALWPVQSCLRSIGQIFQHAAQCCLLKNLSD